MRFACSTRVYVMVKSAGRNFPPALNLLKVATLGSHYYYLVNDSQAWGELALTNSMQRNDYTIK